MSNAKSVSFFYKYAGWSYLPGKESPRAGRLRGAKQLAKAETWAREQNMTYEWEDDWDVGNHQAFYGDAYADNEPTTCEMVRMISPDGETLASLGCIDDADSNYRRVVAAELALEVMPS
jgi:hypothetical protein